MRYFKYTACYDGVGPITCYVGPEDPIYSPCVAIVDGTACRRIPGTKCKEVSKAEYDWAYDDVNEELFGRYGSEEFIC